MIDPESGRDITQQAFLEQFLESSICPKNTMNFYQLDGYLRAIALVPAEPSPNEWLPLVFNDLQPDYESAAQAEQVIVTVMHLYAYHCDQVENDLCNLPCQSVYAISQDDRGDIEQWARGFLQGYIVLEQEWNALLNSLPSDQCARKSTGESFCDEIDDILSIVSTVADAKYAIDQGTDSNDLDGIFERLPDTMVLCGQLRRDLLCS